MTRENKIARLPREARDQLNRRLDEAQECHGLLEWLNGHPEVQTMVVSEFGGHPLGPEDLSEWTENGYRDCVAQRRVLEDARRLAADVEELEQAGATPLTDVLASYLTAQYAVATRAAVRQAGGESVDLPTLRALSGNLVALRRGDHSAQWISLERKRLELQRQRSKDKIEEICLAWAKNPENQQKFLAHPLTEKEMYSRIRAVYGLAPMPEEDENSDPPGGPEATA